MVSHSINEVDKDLGKVSHLYVSIKIEENESTSHVVDCRTLTFGENCFKLGCINFETTVSYNHD